MGREREEGGDELRGVRGITGKQLDYLQPLSYSRMREGKTTAHCEEHCHVCILEVPCASKVTF